MCKFLPFIDKAIRTKTLSLFQEIYSNIGEELWNMIEISDESKEILKENLCTVKDGDLIEEDDKINKGYENMKILISKNEPISEKDLDKILNSLLIEDPKEQLDAIIFIHENICDKFYKNKDVLIPNIDKIITMFKRVLHKYFYINIQIKFAKYLSIGFCKLTANKELISHLSYNILLDTSRELIHFLFSNRDEENIIFKSINSTMLRILENCDITFVVSSLLELIKQFHERDNEDEVNLTIKCLLKTIDNLPQNIDYINISKILLQIHLLLLSLQDKDIDLDKESETDTLIINTVKNIVEKFVKYKKGKILKEYSKSVKKHQFHDKFILKWIKEELEKF